MRVRDAAMRGARLVRAKVLDRNVPFHVLVYPTMRCNRRCVYCSLPYDEREELPADAWCAIFDELRALGAERVGFLGGEPLLRSDLDRLIGHVRELGMACTLTSNGARVPDRPEIIRQLSTLIVSLDGDEAAHDDNRGAGSYADAIRAIETACGWDIPVKVNAVLNARSADSLDTLLSFCAARRLPLTINFMRSEPTGLWHRAADHRLSDARVRNLVDRIIEARRTNPWIVFSTATYRVTRRWHDYSRDRLTAAEAGRKFAGPPCSAGRFHLAITQDGCVYPCPTVFGVVPALNARRDGLVRALEVSRNHGCAACYSPCMIEQNALFALRPAALAALGAMYLRTRLA